MITITAQERSEIDIDINLIVKNGKSLDIHPNVRNFFSIDYKPKSNSLILFSGKYIGVIPINKNLFIDIKPKFSIVNLTRIISLSGEYLHTLAFFNRDYCKNTENSNVIYRFLVESLITEMKTLYEEGMLKKYITKKEVSSKIKGKINFSNSINKLWSKGKYHKISIEYDNLTINNEINKLIKHTLLEIIKNSKNTLISIQKNTLKNIIFFISLFDDIEDIEISAPSFFYKIECDNENLGDLRNYYRNIINISKLILLKHGVIFESIGEDISLNTSYIDMETIFEKYLYISIKKYFNQNHPSYSILDGNTDGKKKFFNQPCIAQGDAKPDIIVKSEDKIHLIADVKYKNKTKDTDRYQVISHAISFNCKICVLILPKPDNYSSTPLRKLGSVGELYQINVYEYYFDLSSDSLELEEEKLSSIICSLIKNIPSF